MPGLTMLKSYNLEIIFIMIQRDY